MQFKDKQDGVKECHDDFEWESAVDRQHGVQQPGPEVRHDLHVSLVSTSGHGGLHNCESLY